MGVNSRKTLFFGSMMSAAASKLLAVVHSTSPYLTVYNVSGATPTKITNPITLPTGTGLGVAFSPDGSKIAVGHMTSPYLTVYNVNGDALTKIPNPNTLPTGTSNDISFNPDGTKLAVSHGSSPYLTVYNVNGGHKTSRIAR